MTSSILHFAEGSLGDILPVIFLLPTIHYLQPEAVLKSPSVFDGIMNIHLLTPQTATYHTFESDVRRKAALPPINMPIPDDMEVGKVWVVETASM